MSGVILEFWQRRLQWRRQEKRQKKGSVGPFDLHHFAQIDPLVIFS